jgi:hypothetical protein
MDKTKIIPYHHKTLEQSNFSFKYDNEEIQMKYKYLGRWIHENLNMMNAVQPLAASAESVLGCIITNFVYMGNMN